MKEVIQTLNAPKPSGPYSQGVKTKSFIFVSGQDGVKANGESVGASIAAQTTASLDNIKNILAEKNVEVSNLVFVTCYLSDLNEETVREFNQTYESYFKDVEVKPARITIGCQLLETDVEITGTALVD
ncbi:2-iminobutanoate/2-iminopropanoate deaminase [Lentibacillus halodurans]|uniref:2-iminobutanoate/2-iminopropanoate deaminase n=1 Tax=Lentibacillus halodurans TaxID=237679 RepID=A0A1I1AP33_9BACI|nr:Rid family hydrolase [Lentibacillus halodurans]SFB39166.1 2-iminobutanoate/2-iminopropanoate deaminase [Lentibacillus halodurans]